MALDDDKRYGSITEEEIAGWPKWKADIKDDIGVFTMGLKDRIQNYLKKKTGIGKLEKAFENRSPSSVERKQLREPERLEEGPKLTQAKKRKKINPEKSKAKGSVSGYYMRGGKLYKAIKE